MHACTVDKMGTNQTCFVWRHQPVKLVVKVIVLTMILQVSSMAFAHEMILSMLILLTIALTTAAVVIWRADEHAPFEASESSVAMSDREMTVLVIED
jgi:hypothetical protein